MPTWLEFVVLVLAAGQLVDFWFNASLIAPWRNHVFHWEPRDDPGPVGFSDQPAQLKPLDCGEQLLVLACELLKCVYCLMHHAALWSLVLFVVAGLTPPPWGTILRAPIYWLALVRAALLLNSLLPARVQHYRPETAIHVPDSSDDTDTQPTHD